jgi:hypothetical protein
LEMELTVCPSSLLSSLTSVLALILVISSSLRCSRRSEHLELPPILTLCLSVCLFVSLSLLASLLVAKADVGIAMGGGTDVAMESADMVLMRADVFSVVVAIDLSHAILRCIRRNLFWALAYNVIAIPIAAGLSVPIFHAIIPPWVAGGAMALSSVSVVISSLSLLYYQPPQRLSSSLESGESSSSTQSETLRKSPLTTSESPLPSPLTGFDKLLSFADGFEFLEMEENKPLLSSVEQPEAKKRIYGSDTRV